MIMRHMPTTRSAGVSMRGALVLALAALVAPAVYAQTVSGNASGAVPALYAADAGLPGDGRPPSPGPTDPDGPSY